MEYIKNPYRRGVPPSIRRVLLIESSVAALVFLSQRQTSIPWPPLSSALAVERGRFLLKQPAAVGCVSEDAFGMTRQRSIQTNAKQTMNPESGSKEHSIYWSSRNGKKKKTDASAR